MPSNINQERHPKFTLSVQSLCAWPWKVAFVVACFAARLCAQPFGEAAYNFLGDHPGYANVGWHEEAQGLAHDRDNWFITQKDAIWKIPVTHNLSDRAAGAPHG